MATFVTLGPHIVDVLGRPVTHIPEGQGGALLTGFAITVAGTAGGAAVDLARLGQTVRSVGAIGDDGPGRFLRHTLDGFGVDTSALVEVPGVPTSGTILPIRPNGERPALHLPGATEHLTAAALGENVLDGADFVHVGGPDRLGRFAQDELAPLLVRAKRAGAVVTLDLLGVPSPAEWTALAEVVEQVDHLLINDQQATGITGTDDAAEAARRLHAAGIPQVVVTTGAAGGVLADRDGVWTFPALTVEVVDTTGCGDAFSAGYLVGLSQSLPARAACGLGTCCAALVAGVLGSDGIPDLSTAQALVTDRWQPLLSG